MISEAKGFFQIVAPFAGAWIEMSYSLGESLVIVVAPFAGAWIEITSFIPFVMASTVAPFAGAWIEIEVFRIKRGTGKSRSLRGSVD